MSLQKPPPINLTPEQRAALAEPTRVTVIRAGPGTGKTRVFVAELQRRLAAWTDPKSGIAAVSFTNVARDEIENRLGGVPPGAHFVGTLDSFVWRFIVRPFARLVGVASEGPRLIPAPLNKSLDYPCVKVGTDAKERESIFRLTIEASSRGLVKITRQLRYGGRATVQPPYANAVLEQKRNEWLRRGRVTHSDCHALAAKLIHGEHGDALVDLIARRFPVLLLDEFQDTNRFLAGIVLKLLTHDRVESLVVGDPDQAIFTFGGADQQLFDHVAALDGASVRPLRTTHRFGRNIALCATALARSTQDVTSKCDVSPGRIVIVTHRSNSLELDDSTRAKLQTLIDEAGCDDAAFLARRNTWVARASGATSLSACPLSATTCQRLHVAVEELLGGNSATAAAITARVLGEVVLDESDPSREHVTAAGIEWRAWRQQLHRLLFLAAENRAKESWDQWRIRVQAHVEEADRVLRGAVGTRKLGGKFRRGKGGSERKLAVRPQANVKWEPLTVHQAKGREFDGVVVHWPRPGGHHRARCPSDEWWSTESGSEEREVAYVAATRAKKLLVFCLHEQTVAALQAKRAGFTALFELE